MREKTNGLHRKEFITRREDTFVGRITPAIFLAPVAVSILFVMLYIKTIEVLSQSTLTSSFLGGLFLILSFMLLFVAVVLHIRCFIVIWTFEFAITNKRIIKKVGLIRRITKEILLSKVESISIDQNILGRILGFGTIVVTGTGGSHTYMKSIVDPVKIRNQINKVLESLKI